MLRSMTAYARVCKESPAGRFSIEINCVNRKHLEINTSLPNELLRYDTDIKKWISTVIGRGSVNVKINVAFNQESPLTVTPNLALARELKRAWEKIAAELSLTPNPDELLQMISKEEGLLSYEQNDQDEEFYRQTLKSVTEDAIQHLIAMKEYEGTILHQDIKTRFLKLASLIKLIENKAPGATERYRQRLVERVKEVSCVSADSLDERILREVCLYAEKIDIAEEIVRFNSHLQQVDKLIDSKRGHDQGVGKPLEFLIQELNREINTIGSKSSDTEVSHWVIEIKTELERIREQIQNIE